MRVLSYVQSLCSPRRAAALLYLQMLYVVAYGEVLGVVAEGDGITVLRAGATTNEGGGFQGSLELDPAGENGVGDDGVGGSPSLRDYGSPPRVGEKVPTPTTTSPPSAAVLYDSNTSTASPSIAPSLTGGHLSHER
jgi:hypothetical protein